VIADAIRNVRKYAQQDNFSNLRGGDDQNFGESIQFDSKGVEFGPWLARFLAQVRSNWMIPQAAMSMHGHVAISLVVHKDGRITDVTVAKPSLVNAFTLSGRNAILTSNPTIPLPAEYPDERMPILITFFFNEYPPGR
jgi:TonB family protein